MKIDKKYRDDGSIYMLSIDNIITVEISNNNHTYVEYFHPVYENFSLKKVIGYGRVSTSVKNRYYSGMSAFNNKSIEEWDLMFRAIKKPTKKNIKEYNLKLKTGFQHQEFNRLLRDHDDVDKIIKEWVEVKKDIEVEFIKYFNIIDIPNNAY